MTDAELALHERSLRLYKGIVHGFEHWAKQQGNASFLPIAEHLRTGADEWDAWVTRAKTAGVAAPPPRRPIP